MPCGTKPYKYSLELVFQGVALHDMNIKLMASSTATEVFEGRNRTAGEFKWSGRHVDLVFGLNSRLRAIAQVYACDDAQQAFVVDFVTPWSKVMNLDRFDLA